MEDRFDYQSEKLAQARSCLMAPHEMGEAQSFASAFEFCSRAFYDLDVNRIEDENAQGWIASIKELMKTDGLDDPAGEGLLLQRARAMTVEERRAFSDAVDELASWFDSYFWSDHS